ncbi:hypothetical protein HMPREF9080_00452 [Cardiobacterium valvarum F0432]|uniref:Uncharacterized protein n=1 Tax=Cardiobacterium valvarum F0432 TaxID=797473 RepID=G9ZCH5_9GAMM|nr:hypothetical protein HMPREF9080_00452 [Cardiobacterium valvarum F0432]
MLRAVAVQAKQLGISSVRRGMRVGNEFKQGFGVVGGDVRVGVGTTESGGVGGAGEGGIRIGAQGFAFDADVAVSEGQGVHGGWSVGVRRHDSV